LRREKYLWGAESETVLSLRLNRQTVKVQAKYGEILPIRDPRNHFRTLRGDYDDASRAVGGGDCDISS
jgi:hypothetical protein